MGLPSTSSPFEYLVRQIREDLDHAAELCSQIRRTRHVGAQHAQLDALENALADGAGFVLREKRNYTDLEGADLDGGDDFARADFTGYVRQVEEINSRLEAIAHPPTHHQGHYHHYHSLFCDPHCHKSKEEPHFYDLRLKWENVHDGISQTFAALKLRLDTKTKDKNKEDEAKEKAKNEKDEAVRKLEDEAEELKRKIAREERHQEARREVQEDTQDKRDRVVEGLVKTTLEKDPIDNLDHLATVMGHIQRVVTPRTSHSAISVPWNLNVNSTASGAGSGSGTGGSPRVICVEDHHSKRASRHHIYRSRSSSTSSSDSLAPHHHDPPIINDINVIQGGGGGGGGGGGDYSIDEASTISSHGGHHHRRHLTEHAHQHGHRRSIGHMPIIVNGVPGEWNPEHHDYHEHHQTIRL